MHATTLLCRKTNEPTCAFVFISGRLELELVQCWLALCLRATSLSLHNRSIVTLTRFLQRIRASVYAIHHRQRVRLLGCRRDR